MRQIDDKVDTVDNYPAVEFNSIKNELTQTVLTTDQVLAAGSNVQVSTAMATYAGDGDYYLDTGVADAYVLTAQGLREAPISYTNGQMVRFTAANTNTGASTINVESIGVVSIVRNDGSPLQAGDIPDDAPTTLVNDTTNFRVISFKDVNIDPLILPETDKTIASETITADKSTHSVTGPAASNNLDIILGFTDGYRLTLRLKSGANDVVIRDRNAPGVVSGNIILANPADETLTMEATNNVVSFIYNADLALWIQTFNNVVPTVVLPRNTIDGFIMSNAVSDVNKHITIGAGQASDSTNAFVLDDNASMTKQAEIVWAPGDNAGGMPSALTLTADTWYHTFAILKDDGTTDRGFDTALDATNLLSDAGASYIGFRRVGSVLTDSSNDIEQFLQFGDRFYWIIPTAISTPTSVGSHELVIKVPIGLRVLASISYDTDISNIFIRTSIVEDSDIANQIHDLHSSISSTGLNKGFAPGLMDILSSVTATFRFNVIIAGIGPGSGSFISMRGWKDFRGKQ